ncbi:MAG: NfeD family protein [Actinomycetota bacterium]|nr:NfeD family protein [Actinomycetota bacterium]
MSDLGNWMSDHPGLTWAGVAFVLAVLELLSLDLVLLMFALGALGGAVVAGLGGPLWLSIVVFVAISMGLLFVARPSIVARLHAGPTLTQGHQALVGRVAVVIEPVTWRGGRVQLASENWSARTASEDESFEAGTDVLVTQIDGATAVVTGKATS